MIFAKLVLTLLVTTGAEGNETPLILDFTATWCGPCQAMRPTVEELRRKGYPIKPVDIDQHPELAERYKVTGVPTFVAVTRSGRELGRISGARPATELTSLYKQAQARLEKTREVAVVSDESETTVRGQDPDDAPADEEAPEAQPPAEGSEAHRPWETVVRIKVFNHLSRPRPTIGFGSGTIVHSTDDEAYILTCAHIFNIEEMPRAPHPTKFPLKVTVDLFDGKLSKERTPRLRVAAAEIPAEVLDYDFSGDVGLIKIKTGRPLPFAKVVPPGWSPRRGDKMTTLGCSEGRDATAWTTYVTNPLLRLGNSNGSTYEGTECDQPPLEGRSGGGLFTMGGLVAGVCDFHDGPRPRHGIYASPKSIHRMLDRNRLQVCYLNEAPGPRPDRPAIARNDASRRGSGGSTKLRSQSPQEDEKGLLPVPTPEVLGVTMPAPSVADSREARPSAPTAAGSRYRWQAAPASDLGVAEASPNRPETPVRRVRRPQTAGMELDSTADDGDLFAGAPDFDAPAQTEPLPGSSAPRDRARPNDRWRAADPAKAASAPRTRQ
jgi:hypothetical protein